MERTMDHVRNGVPYDVHLRPLREAFPTESISPGRVFSHEEIERAVNTMGDCGKNTGRYQRIVKCWRSELRDAGHLTKAISGVGIEVLRASDAIAETDKKMESGFRRVSQAGSDAVRIDRTELNESERVYADEMVKRAAMVEGTRRLLCASRDRGGRNLRAIAHKRTA